VVVTCSVLLSACILANPQASLKAVAVLAAAIPLSRYVCCARLHPGGEELTAKSNQQELRAE